MPALRSTISEAGFVLNRREPVMPIITEDLPLSQVNQTIPNGGIGLDKLTINRLYINQNLQSSNFVSGSVGWQIQGGGDVEFNDGSFRGDVEVGSIHIPDQDTTANSAHIENDGDTWWGCTQTDWTADPDNAPAWVKKDGSAKFQNAIIAGSLTNFLEFTSNEDLTSGDPIKVVNESGTSKIESVKGIYNQTNASGAGTTNLRIIDLATDKILVAWADGAAAKVKCGSISAGVVTYGAVVTLAEATASHIDEIDIVRVNDTTAVLISVGSNNAEDVLGNVLTISGTTITDANQYVIEDLGTTSHSSPIAIEINTNILAFAWHDGQANVYRTAVWTVTGDTMAETSTGNTEAVSGGPDICGCKIEDDKYILIYDDASTGKARYSVVTLSGGTISLAAAKDFGASQSNRKYPCEYISDNVIAVLYDSSSNTAGKISVYTESAGTLTVVDTYNITTVGADGDILFNRGQIYHFVGNATTTKVDVTIVDYDTGGALYFKQSLSFGVATSTFRWNHIAEYNDGLFCCLVGANVICGGFDYSLYCGTVYQDVLTGATGKVLLLGSEDENQTSLLPNFNTFLDANGTITLNNSVSLLSADFDSYLIGRATSTTNFILTDFI